MAEDKTETVETDAVEQTATEDAAPKAKAKAKARPVDREARDALLAILPILESQSWPVDVSEAIAKINALEG